MKEKIMKKYYILYLVSGIMILILVIGGWYAFRYHLCLKQVNYVPPREQSETGGGLSGLRPITDKGDYYRFDFREFKTLDETLHACIWK